MAKIRDLTMLSDIFPTGYHGAYTAGVTTGFDGVRSRSGPGGPGLRVLGQLLGAAVVIVGDMNPERLKQAESFGCETVDLSQDATLADQIEQILGEPEVDAAVDCVGFEARGHGHGAGEAPATVLNDIMTVARAGARPRHPRPLRDRRPRRHRRGRQDRLAEGAARPRLGQVALLRHRPVPGNDVPPGLMMAILHDKAHIADAVNATVIPLDRGTRGLPGLRPGRGPQVRHRPAWADRRVTPGPRFGRRRPAGAGPRARSGGRSGSFRTGAGSTLL